MVIYLSRPLVLLLMGWLLLRVIKRHGRAYAHEVFRGTQAANTFLALADIAYYLIVGAYTLFNLDITNSGEPLDNFVQGTIYSIGGLCLIIGILHLVNVVFLPFIGHRLGGKSGIDQP